MTPVGAGHLSSAFDEDLSQHVTDTAASVSVDVGLELAEALGVWLGVWLGDGVGDWLAAAGASSAVRVAVSDRQYQRRDL